MIDNQENQNLCDFGSEDIWSAWHFTTLTSWQLSLPETHVSWEKGWTAESDTKDYLLLKAIAVDTCCVYLQSPKFITVQQYFFLSRYIYHHSLLVSLRSGVDIGFLKTKKKKKEGAVVQVSMTCELTQAPQLISLNEVLL